MVKEGEVVFRQSAEVIGRQTEVHEVGQLRLRAKLG